jgi:hypothetical protein
VAATGSEGRLIGYSDGYVGYLVDPPARTAGTYEALSSPLANDTPQILITALTRLSEQARHPTRPPRPFSTKEQLR